MSGPHDDLFNTDIPFETARISLDEAKAPPRERCLCGSILPLAKPSLCYGPSGVGKSGWIAGLSLHVAGGLPEFCGMRIWDGGGPVLVYDAEDGLDDWVRKAGAQLAADPTFPMAQALARLHVYANAEGFARLTEEVSIRHGDETRREQRPTRERDRIVATAKRHGARLILLETTSRLAADEDNASFASLISAVGHIARATGAATLLTHHTTKAAAANGDRSPEAARGGYALIANSRNAISLYPATPKEAARFVGLYDQADLVVLEHKKTTSSVRRQPPILLIRQSTDHGGVFRLAEAARNDSRAMDAAIESFARAQARQQRGERLRTLVAQLVADDEEPTERRLREFTTALDIPKAQIAEAVRDAKADEFLRQGKRVRGGGRALLPGELAQVARPELAQVASPPLGQSELAQVVSPLGGPVPRASSDGEVAQMAQVARTGSETTRASSNPRQKDPTR